MGASSTEFDAEYGADQIQILEGLEAVRKARYVYRQHFYERTSPSCI